MDGSVFVARWSCISACPHALLVLLLILPSYWDFTKPPHHTHHASFPHACLPYPTDLPDLLLPFSSCPAPHAPIAFCSSFLTLLPVPFPLAGFPCLPATPSYLPCRILPCHYSHAFLPGLYTICIPMGLVMVHSPLPSCAPGCCAMRLPACLPFRIYLGSLHSTLFT